MGDVVASFTNVFNDVIGRLNSLMIPVIRCTLSAGVPKKGSTIVPNVAGFFMAPEGLVPESTLYLKDTKTLSYVRVFPDAGGFVIGAGSRTTIATRA
jgi:hypothetical protein